MTDRLHYRLGRLVELRERGVDQAQARWAEQQGLCVRLQGAVDRLESLARTAGAAPAAGPLTSGSLANGGAYKESLLRLADGQRQVLAQGRADAQAAQAVVMTEARRLAAVSQAQDRLGARLQQAASRGQQKEQDAVATQMWLRAGRR